MLPLEGQVCQLPETEELICAASLWPEVALVLQQPTFYSGSERHTDEQGKDFADDADELDPPVIGRLGAVTFLVQGDEL